MSDNHEVDALFEDDPGSLEEVFDEDDAEDLKLDDVDTKVWLVKVSIIIYFSFALITTLYSFFSKINK